MALQWLLWPEVIMNPVTVSMPWDLRIRNNHISQLLRINDNRSCHAQLGLHLKRRGEGVSAWNVKSHCSHADTVDVAFGFFQKEGDWVIISRAVHIVHSHCIDKCYCLT